MTVLGIHILDLAIILVFLAVIIGVGVSVSRGIKHQTDFFLGGRTLGRWLQFFLNFGNMTDSTGAVTTSSEIYRQGVGGLWLSFQTLFITPFYWFSAVWYRRVRLMTMADLYVDRFDSRVLASAYATFNIVIALIALGLGNVVTFKVASAMTVKPAAAYTAPEREAVEQYQEYRDLKARLDTGSLTPENRARLDTLDSRFKRGELRSFVSYLHPGTFYLGYTAFIILYIVLGGLRAAAICDAIQGILVVIMSVLLIPVGLHAIGGFSGLHQVVPQYKFELFGSVAMSEYTVFSIAAITFASMIQIFGLMHNITVSGSAKDETAARLGAVSGGFTKRVVLIAWALCGLIALAVFARNGGISDPDNAWGALSVGLLPQGLMGLMLAGMLLGHMPAVGASAVSISALVTRNLYEPRVKGRSPKHYVRIGQLMVGVVLVTAILVALYFRSAVEMLKLQITFNTYFGAVVLLTFFWRRLTAGAVMIGLVIWVLLIGIIPWTLPNLERFRQSERLLRTTVERQVEVTVGAAQADVDAGRARRVGESIVKLQALPPRSVFFDGVARAHPENPNSPIEGIGRFNAEVYLVSRLGVPVQRFSPAGLVTTRWLFDGLFPFVMLLVFSQFTRQADPDRIRRFYAKMKTPVHLDPDQDRKEMELSLANPERFDRLKLFPHSQWEFGKWDHRDFIGFVSCLGVVVAILTFLITLLKIGA